MGGRLGQKVSSAEMWEGVRMEPEFLALSAILISGDRPHPYVRREGREPLQTKQGNRHTGHDQKGRRGSDEVVPGTSVVPSSETGMSR